MHGNDNYQSLMVPLEREKYTWGLGYIYNILCLKNKQKESKANTMICLKLVRRVYSFPVAATQIITALVAYSTTNLSSYSSRAQKSKISLTGLKVSGRTPGDSPSGTSQDSSFPSLPFPAAGGHLHPLAHEPLPPSKPLISLLQPLFLSSHLGLWLSSFPLSLIRTFVVTSGPFR